MICHYCGRRFDQYKGTKMWWCSSVCHEKYLADFRAGTPTAR